MLTAWEKVKAQNTIFIIQFFERAARGEKDYRLFNDQAQTEVNSRAVLTLSQWIKIFNNFVYWLHETRLLTAAGRPKPEAIPDFFATVKILYPNCEEFKGLSKSKEKNGMECWMRLEKLIRNTAYEELSDLRALLPAIAIVQESGSGARIFNAEAFVLFVRAVSKQLKTIKGLDSKLKELGNFYSRNAQQQNEVQKLEKALAHDKNGGVFIMALIAASRLTGQGEVPLRQLPEMEIEMDCGGTLALVKEAGEPGKPELQVTIGEMKSSASGRFGHK